MKNGKVRQGLIGVTFFVVCLLGLLSLFFILDRPTPELSSTTKFKTISDGRSPASLSAAAGAASSSLTTLDLNCEEQSYEIEPSSQVRIRGGLCNKEGPAIERSSIFNKRNGFVAAVFQNGKNEFSTDFIQLSSGENEIVIEHTLKDSSVEQRHIKIRLKNLPPTTIN